MSAIITKDYMVISPAYGRDYKSKSAAEAAFRSGEDWVFESVLPGQQRGRYCNIRDFAPGVKVEIRYKGLGQATIITI